MEVRRLKKIQVSKGRETSPEEEVDESGE